jgi:hypothetical protein
MSLIAVRQLLSGKLDFEIELAEVMRSVGTHLIELEIFCALHGEIMQQETRGRHLEPSNRRFGAVELGIP